MSKGERTKNYIIEQSSILFNKQGYKSTSISDIMSATGLKKGGIYNHFENKDSLAEASFLHSLNRLKENYKEAVLSKDSAREQFNAFIEIFSTLTHDEVVIGGCPLLNAAIEADDSIIHFEEEIKEGFTGLLKLLKRILEHGIKQNEISEHINSEELSIFILSSLEGSLALSRLYKDIQYLKAVTIQLNKLLFK